jgi:hypothetical protein
MISRIRITCTACNEPITARIQIGHEREQPVSFPCPHCITPIQLTLILDEPPEVKIRWEENAEPGDKEGKIINIGAGFTISKNMLHTDLYFPSFDVTRSLLDKHDEIHGLPGPIFLDSAEALGTFRYANETWHNLEKALRFQRTGQQKNLESQLDEFWGTPRNRDETLENALSQFFLTFLEPNGLIWFKPVIMTLQEASSVNPNEYAKFVSSYDTDLKTERFKAYSDIISEYFRGYGDFSQTLIYVRQNIPLPAQAVATSSDFEKTKMFYGNAFEVMGSHLDVPAVLNNIISGRPFDKMISMDLNKFRTINKANRTNCFANNTELSWLVAEYDSTIRNASHHRWFKLDDSRQQISYRSGGTGALQHMSYAEYLYRCNRLLIRLIIMLCMELMLLHMSGKGLS